MRLVLICELVALLVFPFLVAILHRRGLRFEKLIAITLATLLGLLMGTYWLYLINPETLFSLTAKDWLSAVGFALFCWTLVYPLSRWLYKQWFQ
jgi:L-cystine uptake protein TcyP (sodium:dicarboxylate symporter family)